MSETYTFKTLTCKPVPNGDGNECVMINEVVIPRIQRAYAQGRKDEKATAIREKLLNDIFRHLISDNDNDVMDLHFMYGSVKEEEKLKGQVSYVLELLDGQQRFTTLYLLHWYLLQKEGMFESEDYKDLRNALLSFSYETRATATDFCNSLVKYGCNFGDSTPGSAIKKARWYYRSYDKDATIAGMLTMLDAIDERYKANNASDLLPRTDRLQFYVLPLMEYNLSEELYMKMNARGLELTQFDNFKAEFCSAMKGRCDRMVPLEGGLQNEVVTQEENIAIKLDAKWIDLFWSREKPDSDISYMRFFSRFFATRYMVDFDIPAKELERDLRLGAIYTKTEGQKGGFGFDAYKWILENKPDEFVDSYFSAVEKVLDTLFDNKATIARWLYPCWSEDRQGNFMVDASVSFNQSYLVVFGAICEYILRYERFEEDIFKEWMRIVWNVVENTDINNLSTAAIALRLLTALVAFSAKASGSEDARFNDIKVNETAQGFYEAVSKAGAFKRFDSSWSRSVKEEIEKARRISEDSAWLDAFREIEAHPFFKGSVAFYYSSDNTLDEFRHNCRLVKELFDKSGITSGFRKNHVLMRAIVSRLNKWDGALKNQYIVEKSESNKYLKNLLLTNEDVKAMLVDIISSGDSSDDIYDSLKDAAVSRIQTLDGKTEWEKQVAIAYNTLCREPKLYDWIADQEKLVRISPFKGHIAISAPSVWYERYLIDTERDAIAKDLIETYGFIYRENDEYHMSQEDKDRTGHYKGEFVGLFLPLGVNDQFELWVYLHTDHNVLISICCPTVKKARQLAALLPGTDQEKRYLYFKRDENGSELPQLKYLTRRTGKAIQERLDSLIPGIKKAIKAID
ncbi:MAG: DUF262 domain-containing protein [Paramuribaculum sp.]|nr:DUF262 domain-containing protein [Paramuribaculum sp.]